MTMKPQIDVYTLSDEELRDAIRHNGYKWGSFPYYVEDEIKRALADREGVRVYRDDDGTLRAYYRTPAQREADAERDRQIERERRRTGK